MRPMTFDEWWAKMSAVFPATFPGDLEWPAVLREIARVAFDAAIERAAELVVPAMSLDVRLRDAQIIALEVYRQMIRNCMTPPPGEAG